MKKYIKPISKEVKVNLTELCMITVSGEHNGDYDAKDELYWEFEKDGVFGW